MALRSSKRCQKNGTGELFAFAGSNNDICIISGLKIEKTGPETGTEEGPAAAPRQRRSRCSGLQSKPLEAKREW